MKKMSFSKLGIYLFCLVTLATLLAVGNLAKVEIATLKPQISLAQTQPSVGRVLQQATTTCDNNSAFDLSIAPSEPKIGDTVVVSYKPTEACKASFQGVNWGVGLYQGVCINSQCDQAAKIQDGLSLVSEKYSFLITPELMSPGQKAITVRARLVEYTEKGVASTLYRNGNIQFKLLPAATDGTQNQLKLAETKSELLGVGGGTVRKTITILYAPGAEGFSYVCNAGGTKVDAKFASGATSATFYCDYEKKAGEYKITASVTKNGQVIPGVEGSLNIKITGLETGTNTGQVTAGEVSTGSKSDCIGFVATPLCIVNLILGAVGQFISTLVRVIFLAIVGPFIEGLVSVRTYSDTFANVIYPSWLILRNLTNIAFILAIVAMGVATVFRISGYAVKDMMIKLIIGAFLVNFSLVIPQAILGIAETVQNQFLPPNTGAIRAIANPLFTLDLFSGPSNISFGSFENSIRIFMNMWLVVFAFIAFVGIMCILGIRLVVLWLLLLSSPLPYAAMIFPATRKLASDWWSRLFEWAFITPVMAFMLNLTANITISQKNVLQNLFTVPPGSLGVNTNILFVALNAFIPIAFLFATLKVASAFATKSGGVASTVLNKASSLAGLGAGGVMGYMAVKPATKVAKNIGQWGKDRTQMTYLNQLNKLKPKEGDEASPTGRLKSWIKARAFNVASGGAITAENQAVRKGKIDSMKVQTKGIAKDYRLVSKEIKPQIAKQLADQEYRKDIKERLDLISSDTKEETEQMLKKLLSKKTLDYSEQMSLQAGLIKASQTDKSFGKLLDAPPFGGNIHTLMSKIHDSAGGGEVGHRAMVQFSNEMNAYAMPKGKLQLVTDNNDPRNGALAGQKVENILTNATGDEVARMDSEVFSQGGSVPVPGSTTGRAFSKFILSFREANAAATNLNAMTDKKREAYKRLNPAALEHLVQLNNEDMPPTEVTAAVGNFISQMG